jgi:tRNA(Ile)-lysidine synthase
MQHELFDRFKASLAERALWKPGESVLVAVSGGPDSVGLLLLFVQLRRESPFRLAVAHLHHGLRGRESDEDEEFVVSLAQRLQVPCHTGRLAPEPLREAPEGVEAAARQARYTFLRETAQRLGACRVALGHTRDDQAETFLMRLLRGSGSRGLGSIYPSRDHLFIRPLLQISREALISHLRSAGQAWREDSSNRNLQQTRNRIRHRLLPLLKDEFNARTVEVLARTADLLRDEDDYLEAATRNLAARLIRKEAQGVALAIPALRVLPVALRRRLLRKYLDALSAPPSLPQDFETTAALEDLVMEGRHGKTVTIGPGLEIRILYSDLVGSHPAPDALSRKLVPLPVPGEVAWPMLHVRLKARPLAPPPADPRESSGKVQALLDADALPGPLAVRARLEGDHFRPLGSPGESKLKSYFIDRKVPRPLRDRIPLVVSGDRIAWVVGYQIEDRFKVTPLTRRVVVLTQELS